MRRDASTDRPALKADIIELFRAVERELTELGALKEDVKKLAERWKTIGGVTQPHGAAAGRPRRSARTTSARRRSSRRAGRASRSATIRRPRRR